MSALLVLALILPRAFILAGERIEFDAQLRPHFTEKQVREVPAEVRAGFARWAATPSGRRLIARFDPREYEIVVGESLEEEGPGRAPQPALATLVAANDHHALKSYAVILNPSFRLQSGRNVLPRSQPGTQADLMAAVWAGEMLHVDFYARGISLPHHQRDDFQQEWRAVARELGFPDMPHEDAASSASRRAAGSGVGGRGSLPPPR